MKVLLSLFMFVFVFQWKIIFKRFNLFIFRDRGKEGEREGGKHQCVVASHVAPTGDQARNPGMCPDWESNGQTLVHSPRSIH